MISLRKQDAMLHVFSSLHARANQVLPYVVIAGWLMITSHLIVRSTGTSFSFNMSERIGSMFAKQEIATQNTAVENETLNISTSPLYKEIAKLNSFRKGMVIYQRDVKTKQEFLQIDALAMLRTDKNRPRVNGDVADLLHPLMAKARLVYKENTFVLTAAQETPESYIKPIVKFVKNFYGWNVVVNRDGQQNIFTLKMAVK